MRPAFVRMSGRSSTWFDRVPRLNSVAPSIDLVSNRRSLRNREDGCDASEDGSSPLGWTGRGNIDWTDGGTDGARSLTAHLLGSWVSDTIPVTPGSGYGVMADMRGSGGTVIVEQLRTAPASTVDLPSHADLPSAVWLDFPTGLCRSVTRSSASEPNWSAMSDGG